MMKVRWLAGARDDLESIGRYIAQDNPAAAYRTVAGIEAAVNLLEHHPHMGRDGRVGKTRELVVTGLPYIIPYYLYQNEIRILAVMHEARKWPDDFSTH